MAEINHFEILIQNADLFMNSPPAGLGGGPPRKLMVFKNLINQLINPD